MITARGTRTVYPFSGGRTDDAEQLVVGDRFRLDIVVIRFIHKVRIGPVQRFPHLRLARAGQADYEDRMSNI